MERHEILDAMSELKLYGMRASFDEIAGKGLARRDEIYPLIASLIRAERTHRQARSISYRIGGAKFPVLKDLEKFVFADTSVDEGQVRELAAGAFLDAKRNAIFIGGTGTGKTHLCIAVATAVSQLKCLVLDSSPGTLPVAGLIRCGRLQIGHAQDGNRRLRVSWGGF
jgi:DNA replication protein DnaC